MSVWGDVKYRAKKLMLAVWGPADLHESRDPQRKLEREHDAEKPDNQPGKDWDRG